MAEVIMKCLKYIMKEHWGSIVLSVLVGLIVLGPNLVFVLQHSDVYQGIPMMGSDAEEHYLARMKESIDTGGLGNPFIKEHRDLPSSLLTVSETLLALPSKIFHVNVANLSLVYKFLLSLVYAILTYAIVFRLTRSKPWSVAGSAMLSLGTSLIGVSGLLHFLKGDMVYTQFLALARPVNPVFSGILFFIFLHLMFSLLRNPKRKWYLALGPLFGLSFYVYFYSFTFLAVLLCVTLAYATYRKSKELIINVFASLVIGLAIGSWAIVSVLRLVGNGLYPALAEASAVADSHAPIVSLAWLLAAVLLGFCLYKERQKGALGIVGVMLLILMTTALLVINQQVVTGISLQEGHYHWYFNIPIIIIVGVVMLQRYFNESLVRLKNVVPVMLVLVAVVNGLLVQASSYLSRLPETIERQQYVGVLGWLSAKAEPQSVIVAPPVLSQLIPIYTDHYVYWENHAIYYLLPDDVANRRFEEGIPAKPSWGVIDYIVTEEELDDAGLSLANRSSKINVYEVSH